MTTDYKCQSAMPVERVPEVVDIKKLKGREIEIAHVFVHVLREDHIDTRNHTRKKKSNKFFCSL